MATRKPNPLPPQGNTPPEGRLRGRVVVITRPVGTAATLARRVRSLGGVPLLLPGLALRDVVDKTAARQQLQAALRADALIFTSPTAVRHAAALAPLRSAARVLAVGQGTARALRRHGLSEVDVPHRQDSEGLLDLPVLRALHGRVVALIGAPGGRGLLRAALVARGAELREVHVYRREPARLGRRHIDAVMQLPPSALLLLSSAEAWHNLAKALPPAALDRLRTGSAVVSSERLAAVAAAGGFARIRQADSAMADDLLAAALDD